MKLWKIIFYSLFLVHKINDSLWKLQQQEKKLIHMNSIYTTSLRTQAAQNSLTTKPNDSSISQPISQSYKDLLFNHLLGIQNLQENYKQNFTLSKGSSKRKNKYSNIAQKMILSQIPPNIGSLNQFMRERYQNRLVYTSKKKRNQLATEENVLKKKMLEKNSQENILRSDSSSIYEKKIASKVLVERIFNQVFNTPLEQFVSKNSIKKQKQSLLDMSTLESLLSNDRISISSNQNKLNELIQSQGYINGYHEKNIAKDRTVRIKFDQETKLKKIYELKSNYYNLKKLQIPEQNPDFTLLIEAQNKLDNYLKQISEQTIFAKRSSNVLNAARKSLIDGNVLMPPKGVNIEQHMIEVSQKFRISRKKSIVFADTIAKVTDDEVYFKRMQFKDMEMGLYMISYISLQRISVIRLQNIQIDQSILFLFLDVLCKFAPQIKPLKEISICSIIIQNVMKFSEKISQVLREINVRRLSLNYTDIGSKQFTKICVGMSENECLQQVEMRNNRIDYMAIKSLEIMLRINKNIKTIDLRGNEITNYPNLKDKDKRIVVET